MDVHSESKYGCSFWIKVWVFILDQSIGHNVWVFILDQSMSSKGRGGSAPSMGKKISNLRNMVFHKFVPTKRGFHIQSTLSKVTKLLFGVFTGTGNSGPRAKPYPAPRYPVFVRTRSVPAGFL